MQEKIAVVGLGYVGLPVAMAMARQYTDVVGFDIKQTRVTSLRDGYDETGEISKEDLKSSSLRLTYSTDDLKDRTVFIVAVPTPIDSNRQPDLTPLVKASRTVGAVLQKGAVVIYESTVYPGVTEDVCGPLLAQISGLRQGVDFHLGYSPERINPGDKEHTFENIVKVVSGDDEATLKRVSSLYASAVKAGVHEAASIKVAEAAKVIENTQRDLNIALMNELSIIFEKMDIRTSDVLKAAGTKWNFLKFTPGLVGGHCIGVDPYYLTAKAEQLGYHPQVILSGRRINDSMGAFVANKLIKLLVQSGKSIHEAKVAIFGLTFKEDVPDLRNSRVPDIIEELKEFGIRPLVHDVIANSREAEEEYGIKLCDLESVHDMDAAILAVPHKEYLQNNGSLVADTLKKCGIVIDVKAALHPDVEPVAGHKVWSL